MRRRGIAMNKYVYELNSGPAQAHSPTLGWTHLYVHSTHTHTKAHNDISDMRMQLLPISRANSAGRANVKAFHAHAFAVCWSTRMCNIRRMSFYFMLEPNDRCHGWLLKWLEFLGGQLTPLAPRSRPAVTQYASAYNSLVLNSAGWCTLGFFKLTFFVFICMFVCLRVCSLESLAGAASGCV